MKPDWMAGLGILGACIVCCSLPLLGGTAILGISSFFLNPLVVFILSLFFVAAAVIIYSRHKANRAACTDSECNCDSCTNSD